MVLALVEVQTLARAQPGLSITQNLSSTQAEAVVVPGAEARRGGGTQEVPVG